MPDGQHTPSQIEGSAKIAAPRPRRLVLLVGIGLVAGLALTIWGVQWWTSGRFRESTNNAYLRADSVVIAPKVSGYVTAVLVADNQSIAAGQPLIRIDDASYRAARDEAAAEVAQRRADLSRFRADVARQQAAIAETEAQVGIAGAAARFAAQDAARRIRLAALGADATRRSEEAVSTREQTAGQLVAAKAAVAVADRDLDSLKAQVGQGEAALAAAEAKLRNAESDLAGVAIAAPVAGDVGDRTVRVGQYVQAGTRLMTLVPVQNIYLIANFKETQVGRMRPGQPVSVTVDAFPDVTIRGVVDSLAPGTGSEFALLPPENATGNFTKIVQRVPVRIRLDPGAAVRKLLRPGLSAEAEVDTRDGGA